MGQLKTLLSPLAFLASNDFSLKYFEQGHMITSHPVSTGELFWMNTKEKDQNSIEQNTKSKATDFLTGWFRTHGLPELALSSQDRGRPWHLGFTKSHQASLSSLGGCALAWNHIQEDGLGAHSWALRVGRST
jgi:hypothetical protein